MAPRFCFFLSLFYQKLAKKSLLVQVSQANLCDLFLVSAVRSQPNAEQSREIQSVGCLQPAEHGIVERNAICRLFADRRMRNSREESNLSAVCRQTNTEQPTRQPVRAKKPAVRKHSGPPARLLNILESVQAQDGLDALLHVVGSDNGVVANFRMQ